MQKYLNGELVDMTPEEVAEFEAAQTATAPTVDDFRQATQGLIDAGARQWGYDSGVSLVSYAGSTIPSWAAEAQAFIAWRDAVWQFAYGALQAVQTGARSAPTVPGFIDEITAALPLTRPS